MSSDQCPVCYESYSPDEQRLTPRQLALCHDVICWGCIEDAIFDGECYCPQCGSLHEGASVEDISQPFSPGDAADEVSSGSASPPPPDELTIAETLMASPKRTRGHCQMEGCHRRAGIGAEDGYCLKHSTSKKRSSLMKETEIAESLMATSLGQVSIDGTKVKYLDPIIAGSNFQPDDLIERFSRQSRMELGEVMTLIDRAKEMMAPEPNVLRLQSPVVVVGDIHGQFYDLVNMLKVGGPLSGDESKQYLFLGDYVDRGHFSCEVMLLLLSLKIAYPKQIWLLRGNHECRSVSGHFGFKEECKKKYGVAVYYNFLLMFQTMPLSAVIATDYGNIFACHGGISPSLNLLEDIEGLDRFVEPEVNAGLLDMLWSDPVHDSNILPADYDEEAEQEYHKYLEIDWRPNPARGCSYCFGYAAIVAFLQKNNFVCLLRAHEVQEEGFHEHFQSVIVTRRVQLTSPRAHCPSPTAPDVSELGPTPPSKEDPYVCLSSEVSACGHAAPFSEMKKCLPLVITVFSAPNYCDRYENKAAILTIGRALQEFQFLQYECVEHPVPDDIDNEMNNQIAAVVASCPYMPTSFQDFVRLALELGFEDDLFEEEEFMPEECPSLSFQHSVDNIVVHTKDGIDHPIQDLSHVSVPKPAGLFPDPPAPAAPRTSSGNFVGSTAGATKTVGIGIDTKASSSSDAGSLTLTTPPSTPSGTAATGAGAVGLGTPPLNPAFLSPSRRSSVPSPLLKSKSLYTVGSNDALTPDMSLKNTSPAVSLFQRPPLAKAPSETSLFQSPRRASVSSPYSSRKALVPPGYVRQRINNIEKINIEVVESPGGSRTERSALEVPDSIGSVCETPQQITRRNSKVSSAHVLNQWRDRRSSAPARRQSVILSASAHPRTNSLVIPRKIDSDDDTNYSERSTPASIMSRRGGRRNSYGSEVSDLSPPFISPPFPISHSTSSIGNVSPLKPEQLKISDSFSKDKASDVPDVVKFAGNIAQKTANPHKRQSFAVASAFDAINERHPKVVLDHLQGIEKSTDMMLASNPGEELNYVDSMDEMDRVDHQESDSARVSNSELPSRGDASTTTNSKPFTRTSIGSLFPSIQSNDSMGAEEGTGLHAPELNDIAGLDLQAPDIIELLDDDGQARRRTLSDSRPRLTEPSESMQKTVVFTREELLGLRLMFSLFDRTGNGFIEYEDLVAYAEETGDFMRLRDASLALDILDIDGDGSIGLLDFIHFASRLQSLYYKGMLNTATSSSTDAHGDAV